MFGETLEIAEADKRTISWNYRNQNRKHRAVIGLYRYTSDVFSVIKELKPSDRGEYEITDVNNHYVTEGELEYEEFDGQWYDAGTPEGVFRASRQIRDD